jgi:NodT family efflux transporter outer membrane factor (OMF) lipoprotein
MNSTFPWGVSRVAAALGLLLLAGCAVGPNFKRPAAPTAGGYTAQPLHATTGVTNMAGGSAQRFVQGLDIPGEWWTLFHSRPLNALIESSLAHNPDLKSAQAALHVAREGVLAQRGAFFPGVSGGFAGSRQMQSEMLAPAPNYPAVSSEFQYNLLTPQLILSYVPHVIRHKPRNLESQEPHENAVRFQLIATYVTLSSNVVVAAIQEASLRAQIAATRRLIALDTGMVHILRYQLAKGYASRLDVAGQEWQLAQAASTLPPLQKQLAQQRDQLAVLAGRFPGQGAVEKFELSTLQLPEQLPVSLPAQLVSQRPDVRLARANLHSASAQIGVAIANRLPNVTLSADAGSTALAIDQVFASGTGFWGVGAAVTAPIFEGGTLLHKERAAKAAYVQAAEQYRSTVLAAFQNVADTLNALEQDANGLAAAVNATAAARTTLELARQQTQAGYAGQLALLNAEQTYEQTRINQIQAQAARFADTAALFQALGGGWWHCADLTGEKHDK